MATTTLTAPDVRPLASLTDADLLSQLDDVERSIARRFALERRTQTSAHDLLVLSASLLALAEREHGITEEFKRRRTISKGHDTHVSPPPAG